MIPPSPVFLDFVCTEALLSLLALDFDFACSGLYFYNLITLAVKKKYGETSFFSTKCLISYVRYYISLLISNAFPRKGTHGPKIGEGLSVRKTADENLPSTNSHVSVSLTAHQ